jgi:Arc/MetJ-type ribon-helix-helix transcriptional regulator
MNKHRLSASVDADLVRAAERAVSEGRAESVSAWINSAMQRQVAHDQRMRSLQDFVAAFEAEHGEITQAEIEAATRKARANAIVVRSRAEHGRPTKRRSVQRAGKRA